MGAGREAAAGLVDNRAESAQLRMLQSSADSSPQAARLAKMGRLPATDRNSVVQRMVFVDRKPVFYDKSSQKARYDDGEFRVGRNEDWFTDAWGRFYANKVQMQAHVGGRPVNVGLAKALGKWYSLPFDTKKIVLGELHGVLKHKTLLDESNRTDTVLSESADARKLFPQDVEDPKTPAGSAFGWYGIEAIAAKTYFGLLLNLGKIRKPGYEAPRDRFERKSVDNAEWMTNYRAAGPTEKGIETEPQSAEEFKGRPYYIDSSRRRVFSAQVEKKYSSRDVSMKMFRKFRDAGEQYLAAPTQGATVNTSIGDAVDIVKNKIKPDEADSPDREQGYTELEPLLLQILQQELQTSFTGADYGGELGERKAKVGAAVTPGKYTDEARDAIAYRDMAMLHSIQAMSDKGARFIGLGNVHALTLKDKLTAAGYEVITYDEFVSARYSTSAVDLPAYAVDDEAPTATATKIKVKGDKSRVSLTFPNILGAASRVIECVLNKVTKNKYTFDLHGRQYEINAYKKNFSIGSEQSVYDTETDLPGDVVVTFDKTMHQYEL